MPKAILKIFLALLLCLDCHIVNAQVADFIAGDTVGCVPKIIHFTNTSTGATSYLWNLGNSTSSTATDASASYTAAGTYTVTLTAYNGATSSTTTKVIRVYIPPTVSYTASDTAVCPGTSVTFTSTSIPNSWGTVGSNWNFGDGGTGSGNTTSYTYNAPGYYNVTLFSTNSPGCTNSLTKNSFIHVFNHSIVGFTATPTSFCKTPTLVTFTNSATGLAPLTYRWAFGDAGTSALANPTHTYVSTGSYNVTLAVKNSKGCWDSLVVPAYINAGGLAASFTNTLTACAKDPVSFNNTSTTHLTSKWSFGDGGSSVDESPYYAYSAPGTYTVKLVIFDGSCYDSITRSIVINALPAGTFSSTPLYPCAPPVNITYTASIASGTTVTWIFGDGTTASGNSTVKNYNLPIIDFVDMNMTNAAGCKKTIERIDTLYDIYLTPEATVTSGCVPLTTNFKIGSFYSILKNNLNSAYEIYSYPYSIASYDWNWDDGTTHGSGPTPSHIYTDTGIHNVTCTILTVNGCTAVGTITIKAGLKATPSFTVVPSRICSGRSIMFNSTSIGRVDNYLWNFGDGSVTVGPPFNSTVHAYSVPGVYTASLKVEHFGCTSTIPFSLTVTVDSPGARIGLTYDCIPKNQVSFRDLSFGSTASMWHFGDGITSTAINPSHVYPSLITYTAMLTTFNSISGCRDTIRTRVELTPPALSFTATKLNLCRGQMDTFYASVIGGGVPAMYKWYVDGVIKDSSTIFSFFRTSFTVPGPHTIRLIIIDGHGCFDTLTKTNYILVAKPTANFSFTPTTICGPASIKFTDASAVVGGTSIANYSWQYGNSASDLSGGSSPSYVYTATGTYSVTEIVTDNIGCSDTFTNPTKVTIYRPAPYFVASSPIACLGRKITFNNLSTSTTTYLWSFGDGSTSTVFAPDHIYTASGLYAVKLIGYDTKGCVDSFYRFNYIRINPSPTASFTMSDTFAVCPPLNVKYTNTSTGANSYVWSFGDGVFSSVISPSEPYTTFGYYNVFLAARNSDGCTDTAIGHVNIFGYKGAFKYTPLAGCSPVFVNFKATLSTVANVAWDFNDGIILSSGKKDTISHFYTTPGAYVPKLILTDTSGCTSFSLGADTIKVDTLIPAFGMNPSPGCVSNNVVFTDSSKSLLSPAKSWLWSFGGGATSTLSTATYSYSATGTYPVTLSVVNATGCSGTITKNILINPAPLPITGLLIICEGLNTNLTDATPGGTWSSNNTAIAVADTFSGLVTGVAPGTATIVYTAPTGCTSTAILKVNPLPTTITGSASVCFGKNTPLSDATPGGAWTSSTPSVATINSSGLVTSVSLGTTTITYKIPTGCLITKTVVVTTTPVAISGKKTICLGNTTSLSDAVPGGLWSSSNTLIAIVGSTSGIVYGNTLGSATITYSLGTGCTVTTPVTVLPTPAAITGSTTPVCAGLTVALANSTLRGVWSSSNTTIATVDLSGIVTAVTGGLDTIYYTLTGSGCAAARTVSVNPTAPITGKTNICVSQTTTLSNALSGGTWVSLNTTVATIGSTSGLVTSKTVGTSTIRYMLSSGCIVSAVLTVISLPLPITGPGSVCVGSSVTLSNATFGGTWESGDTSIATINTASGFMSGKVSGTVLISYSLGTGCQAISSIPVNPIAPVSGPATVCAGYKILLIDTVLGGTWSSTNTSVATVAIGSGFVTGVSAGTVTISYKLASGCTAAATTTVIALPPSITGTMQVCEGLTTRLSDALTGGTWASSNTTVATINSTGLVNSNIAGTTTITYTALSCPIMATVTVNPLPGIIKGSSIGCTGSTSLMSDSTTGGSWASSNVTIATIDPVTGLLTGIRASTVTITYTLPTGCLTTSTLRINPPPPAIKGTLRVCAGLTTNVSNIISGGTWSISNTSVAGIGSTGLISAVSAGTATVSYTLSGCSSTATLTVDPLPSKITGPNAVCEASSIALSDSATGGIWTSKTKTIATIGAGSGIVTGILAGVDTITYTLSNGCLMTTTIAVNPLPAAITGIPYTCATLNSQLSDATTGGNWTSSNTTIADVDATGLVNGNTPGTATVIYTLPATGCTATTTFTVYTFPTAIKGAENICLNVPYTLSDSVTGGTWSSDNTSVAIIGASSGIVTGNSLGVANIYYTIASSCSVSHTVSVMPLPNVYNVTGGGDYCSSLGGVIVGISNSDVGDQYFLFKGGTKATGPLAGSGSSFDFGLQKPAGRYTVLAVNAITGCSSSMNGFADITITPTVTPAITVTRSVRGDTVCSGTTVKLTAGFTNGGSAPVFAWFVNGTKVSTTSTYTFIPANNDVINFMIRSNAVCAIPDVANYLDTFTVLDPVIPSATLSTYPGDTICSGLRMTLTPVPVFGGSAPKYTWFVNRVLIDSGNTFTFAPANKDIVYADMTSNFPCLAKSTVSSNKVSVAVIEPVIPSVIVTARPGTQIAVGQYDTLTATAFNAGTSPVYQWYVNGMPVAGATTNTYISNTFSYPKKDSINCEVTSSGICKMTTHGWIYISLHEVGINDLSAESTLNVIPNPNKGDFTITGSLGTINDEQVSVEITDMLGQVVYKNSIRAKNGNLDEKISLRSTLANSMYLLNVRSGAVNKVFHIVVER